MNSNTTLVKVKWYPNTSSSASVPIQIQHLLKLNVDVDTSTVKKYSFKYNTC